MEEDKVIPGVFGCVGVPVGVSVFDVFSVSESRCWWKMGPKRGIKYLWKPEKLY